MERIEIEVIAKLIGYRTENEDPKEAALKMALEAEQTLNHHAGEVRAHFRLKEPVKTIVFDVYGDREDLVVAQDDGQDFDSLMEAYHKIDRAYLEGKGPCVFFTDFLKNNGVVVLEFRGIAVP